MYAPAQCMGGIGQATSTNYGIPPYIATATDNGCTHTVLFGPPAPHKCITQNLYATMRVTPASGNSVIVTLNDATTSTSTLTCTIAHGATACHDTTQWPVLSHNFIVNQGDQVYPSYTVTQASDATAADIRVSWDCQ